MKKLMITGIILGFAAFNSQAQLSPEKVKRAKEISKRNDSSKKVNPAKINQIKKAPKKSAYTEKVQKTK